MAFLPTKRSGASKPGSLPGGLSGEAELLFEEARRRERRRRLIGLVALLAIIALAVVVYSVGFAGHAERSPRSGSTSTPVATLSRCIESWNRAPLGNGRALADAAGGNGPVALMFISEDGVCGFALPARVAAASGLVTVFVSELGGDYSLAQSPELSVGAGSPAAAHLEALAGKHTNVRVDLPSGKLTATPNASLPTVPVNLVAANAGCRAIPNVAPNGTTSGTPAAYNLVSTTVGCPLVRAITWAWSAGEASSATTGAPASHQQIAGWRCAGRDLVQRHPGTYVRVTCIKRQSTFVVQAALPRTTSRLGTGPHASVGLGST